jgi:starch synthase (maltosyl-transferring)
VNAARKVNPALQHTNNLMFCQIHNDNILAYYKRTGDNIIMCIVKLDPYGKQFGHVQTPLWDLGISPGQDFSVYDILTGNTYTWNQEWNYVQFEPWDLPIHLFRIEV